MTSILDYAFDHEESLAALYPTRKCPACGVTKPRKDFNKNKPTKDALQTYCKLCQTKVKVMERKSSKKGQHTFKDRLCLSCLKMFPSTNIHNRRCNVCTKQEHYSEEDLGGQSFSMEE